MLGIALGGVIVFVALLVLLETGVGVPRVDHGVLARAQAHRWSALVTACRYVTDVVSPPVDAVVLAVGAVLLARRRRQWEPVVVAAAAGSATAAVVLVVKHATHRAAPGPESVVMSGHGGSFPSGHTAMAVVGLGTLALLVAAERPTWTGRLLLAALALSSLVAVALVYAEFHWLSDTIASLAFGAGVLALVALRINRRRAADRTYRRPAAPPTTPQ
jgi:undecaprenyl-diphosphatase